MIAHLLTTARILTTAAVIVVAGFALTVQLIKLDEALEVVRAAKW